MTRRARRHGLRMRRMLVSPLVPLVAASALLGGVAAQDAAASPPPAVPEHITLDRHDMEFILRQILVAEAHPDGQGLLCTDPAFALNPLGGACSTEVTDPTLPQGLRTVSGTFNNLVPGQSLFGSPDRPFPRLTPPDFRAAEVTPPAFGPPAPTSYTQNKGLVFDTAPRMISDLVDDQTADNPAATEAYLNPKGHGFGNGIVTVPSFRNGRHVNVQEYYLPNVSPNVGLAASYNSLFTLFGQFFDHGLDFVTKGGNGTVIVPLRTDDPLYDPGPDGVAGTGDDPPTNFIPLTRATNQPGPDGVLGTADDVKDGTNTTSPWIDQSQTYTSHPSHQVFLREYASGPGGAPRFTGRLLDGTADGLPTWGDVKAQSADRLGIQLVDADVSNVPLLKTDVYGRFIPGPHGFPQIATTSGWVEGDPAANGGKGLLVPAGALRTGHAFLDDIAHNATPSPGLVPDPDSVAGAPTDPQPTGTYDDELLADHYIAGDGRANENIGLTAIHHIFHAEHNREVAYIEDLVKTFPAESSASLAHWQTAPGVWDGDRIFQAARFVTEMEYQHIVFEEFARFVQPAVHAFSGYDASVDPSISAEFAHAVYRFGHSMLTDTVARTNADGSVNDIGLIDAFLNPVSFRDGGPAGTLTPDQAAGSIVQGMAGQRGNEIDEFVVEALRNNLLGLPLDLATLNIARGRSEGIPRLNAARRALFGGSAGAGPLNASVKPYTSWNDYSHALRHPATLVNLVAAYGTHPSIQAATTIAGRRAAADLVVNGGPGAPADRGDFMASTGTWASGGGGVTTTGLDDVDLWVGGLAEAPPAFGGMLGSTFNFVFQTQMEQLQDNDRFYYLSRTAGLHLGQELEANSFAALAMRNTSAKDLPALAFTRPDWTFDLSKQTNPAGVVDDPATPYDETNLDGTSRLVRDPDGTLRLTGKGTTENHSLWAGTPGDDRMWSAEGDDSLWGNDGNDRMEGGFGGDQVNGGAGDDIITDQAGDDVLKGGEGSDAVDGGPGIDILMGGPGTDFLTGASGTKEYFAGSGDDVVAAGDATDTVTGNSGDDWLDGGAGGDTLNGGEGAPFHDGTTGSDVVIGGTGDDLLDGEGGMDVLVGDPGVDRMDGGLGFDWATYSRDTQPVNQDLGALIGAPPDPFNIRDRFAYVEGLAGGSRDDTLRGDSGPIPGGILADPTSHALTHADLPLVQGLEQMLADTGTLIPCPDSACRELAPAGPGVPPPGALEKSFTDGSATAFAAGGNIILGGAGSDLIEGRGGNDLIDGDARLVVALRAPDLSTPDPADTREYANASDLQADVFAGRISPSDISIVRRIDTTGAAAKDIDTVQFSGPFGDYDITRRLDGTVVVAHARGTRADGTDTLRNVERMRFADQTIVVSGSNQAATGTVGLSSSSPVQGQAVFATPNVSDPNGVDRSSILITWEAETAPDVWAPLATGATFTPGAAQVGMALRAVATFHDGLGAPERVVSAPTAPVAKGSEPVAGGASTGGGAPAATTPATVRPAGRRAALSGVHVTATRQRLRISMRLARRGTVRVEVRRPGGALVARISRTLPAGRDTIRWTPSDRRGHRLTPAHYLVVVRLASGRSASAVVARAVRIR